MNNLIRAVLAFLITTLLITVSLEAQNFTNQNDRKLSYLLNVRQGADKTDVLGLDFDVRYELERFNVQQENDNHLSLNLLANGHQDFNSDVTDFNQMTFEARLMGRYYNSGTYHLPPFQQNRYLELLDKDTEEITDYERLELERLIKTLSDKRVFFSYDVHYQFESTQDIGIHQSVFGGGISADLPFLHKVIDGILGITRSLDYKYQAQPIRIYLGYDYSLGLTGERVIESQEQEPYSRAKLEGAWRTIIFDGLVLRSTLNAAYLFEKSANFFVEDNSIQIYSQSWVEVPVNDTFGVTATYAIGKVPPIYSNTVSGKIGFSMKLQ